MEETQPPATTGATRTQYLVGIIWHQSSYTVLQPILPCRCARARGGSSTQQSAKWHTASVIISHADAHDKKDIEEARVSCMTRIAKTSLPLGFQVAPDSPLVFEEEEDHSMDEHSSKATKVVEHVGNLMGTLRNTNLVIYPTTRRAEAINMNFGNLRNK